MAKGQGPSTGKQGILWGLGGALIAHLCCLAPLAALLLGQSGGAVLLALAFPRYRPYFLAVGILLLGGGIAYMLFRSQRTCSREAHRRNLWLYPTMAIASFAVGYLIFGYGVPALAQRPAAPIIATTQVAPAAVGVKAALPAAPGLRVVTLQVDAPA